MKLREFIRKLGKIEKEQGESLEVVMADGIPVVDPVFLEDFISKQVVVITDQK